MIEVIDLRLNQLAPRGEKRSSVLNCGYALKEFYCFGSFMRIVLGFYESRPQVRTWKPSCLVMKGGC